MNGKVKVADLTPAQLKEIKEKGERGVRLDAACTITLGIPLRNVAKKVALEVGLEVLRQGFEILEERHDGGVLTRTYVIRFRGNIWDVVIFLRALDDYIERLKVPEGDQ